LEPSDGDAAVFAVLLDAPEDWFFAPAGSWARPGGEAEQNRHKESRKKGILGSIRMKNCPPDAQVAEYAALCDVITESNSAHNVTAAQKCTPPVKRNSQCGNG
jgi:hypothetical protein